TSRAGRCASGGKRRTKGEEAGAASPSSSRAARDCCGDKGERDSAMAEPEASQTSGGRRTTTGCPPFVGHGISEQETSASSRTFSDFSDILHPDWIDSDDLFAVESRGHARNHEPLTRCVEKEVPDRSGQCAGSAVPPGGGRL